MKKCFATLLALTVLLAVQTGCVSKNPKDQMAKNVKVAAPILEQYISENYPGAKAGKPQGIEYSASLSGMSETLASDYVCAEAVLDGKKFKVFANAVTGLCYDDFEREKIAKSVKQRLLNVAGISGADDIDVHFARYDVTDNLRESLCCSVDKSIQSVDDIYAIGGYELSIGIRYKDGKSFDVTEDMLKKFLPEKDMSITNIFAASCREGRYLKRPLVNCSGIAIGEVDYFYNIQKVVSIMSFYETDYEKNEKFVSEHLETYSAEYKSETLNGLEFVWIPKALDVSLAKTPSKQSIDTPYYSGSTYFAKEKEDTSVKVKFVGKNKRIGPPANIYIFSRAENQKRELLWFNTKDLTEVEVQTPEWKTNDKKSLYILLSNLTEEKETEYQVGFYERK